MSRLRANQITNENANGAPNFPHGLTVTGIVTASTTNSTSSQIVVGSAVTANSQGIDVTGIVTASTVKVGTAISITDSAVSATRFHGDGSQLTGISVDPSTAASSSGFLKVLNASTPQIRLSNDAGDSDDQKRAFFAIATGNNNFLSGSVANDTVLRARGGGDLLIGVGSTIRMRIDELGRVTKPAQPCFSGLNNSGSGSGTAGATVDMKYSTSGGYNFSNVGNVHNASNGRFTAPVAGNYLCVFTNLMTDDKYSYFKVNGAYPNSSSSGSSSYTGDGGYNDLTACAIITLAANDYVTFTYEGSGKVYMNQHGSGLFALLS